MEQMIVSQDTPVLKRMQFGRMACGFFRDCGKIFFASVWGRFTVSFPVREDGVISKEGGGTFFPTKIVDVIHPKNLGITDIRWE